MLDLDTIFSDDAAETGTAVANAPGCPESDAARSDGLRDGVNAPEGIGGGEQIEQIELDELVQGDVPVEQGVEQDVEIIVDDTPVDGDVLVEDDALGGEQDEQDELDELEYVAVLDALDRLAVDRIEGREPALLPSWRLDRFGPMPYVLADGETYASRAERWQAEAKASGRLRSGETWAAENPENKANYPLAGIPDR